VWWVTTTKKQAEVAPYTIIRECKKKQMTACLLALFAV
jgi:hypothetical protein